MATLTVNKVKSKTSSGKWFSCEIEEVQIINGQIFFIPKNKKYQYLKLTANNCIIIK